MASQIAELVGFLHHEHAQVKQVALDALVGYAKDHSYVFKLDDFRGIRDLYTVLKENSGMAAVKSALTILINVCDDKAILDYMAENEEFVKFVGASIIHPRQINADLYCMLLANLAKNDAIVKLLDLEIDDEPADSPADGPASGPASGPKRLVMDCLMDCFVKGSDKKLNPYANFDYLVFFFSDISRLKEGRDYFVNERPHDSVVPLTKILVFSEGKSHTRRLGVASTIKNCLFDTKVHVRFLTDPKINLLPYILLPLAGPEEIDPEEVFDLPEELQLLEASKKREEDPVIQAIYVECLLMLGATRDGRKIMRDKRVYSIIRELHKASNDENVCDLCDRLVQVLMRDEAPENEAKVEELPDEDDAIVEVV